MVEPVPITADPVSSDGSEESWILLDESDDGVKNRFSDSLCDDRCLIRNCIELSDDCGTTDDLDHEISEIKPLDLEENIENHAEIMEEIHDRSNDNSISELIVKPITNDGLTATKSTQKINEEECTSTPNEWLPVHRHHDFVQRDLPKEHIMILNRYLSKFELMPVTLLFVVLVLTTMLALMFPRYTTLMDEIRSLKQENRDAREAKNDIERKLEVLNKMYLERYAVLMDEIAQVSLDKKLIEEKYTNNNDGRCNVKTSEHILGPSLVFPNQKSKNGCDIDNRESFEKRRKKEAQTSEKRTNQIDRDDKDNSKSRKLKVDEKNLQNNNNLSKTRIDRDGSKDRHDKKQPKEKKQFKRGQKYQSIEDNSKITNTDRKQVKAHKGD